MAPGRRRRRLLITLFAAAASFGAASAQTQAPLETAVKATFLYKFAPFVQWPANALAGPGAPFVICVVGADPFGPVLDQAVAGQAVGGRPIVVHRPAAADKSGGCQILYAGGSSSAVAKTLKAVRGAPVLTVTDGAADPGIIDFALDQGRVRFRIDEAQAASNGLSISSKLLSLAIAVKPRRAPGGGA